VTDTLWVVPVETTINAHVIILAANAEEAAQIAIGEAEEELMGILEDYPPLPHVGPATPITCIKDIPQPHTPHEFPWTRNDDEPYWELSHYLTDTDAGE